uniref:Uncharacterized protein TCIL3000_10_670 n=1 Tax=Trypanosoma congolense (strain IL3000) TaxID=1068625 RepID=G0UV93_TRYCI|nr:unnamed protein product [Trypanosoma congolense IL3000]
MDSPLEMYRMQCQAFGVTMNSALLRALPETVEKLSAMRVMHFGRNFLGDRGILPLLPVIKNATSLHTLNLRENGIGNEGVKALCRQLRDHPSLRVLELGGNPFTYLAARQLSQLCEYNSKITSISIDNTLMTEPLRQSILHRINATLKRREQRKNRKQPPQEIPEGSSGAAHQMPDNEAASSRALHADGGEVAMEEPTTVSNEYSSPTQSPTNEGEEASVGTTDAVTDEAVTSRVATAESGVVSSRTPCIGGDEMVTPETSNKISNGVSPPRELLVDGEEVSRLPESQGVCESVFSSVRHHNSGDEAVCSEDVHTEVGGSLISETQRSTHDGTSSDSRRSAKEGSASDVCGGVQMPSDAAGSQMITQFCEQLIIHASMNMSTGSGEVAEETSQDATSSKEALNSQSLGNPNDLSGYLSHDDRDSTQRYIEL